jgi:predicted nucleic acid-binding protein
MNRAPRHRALRSVFTDSSAFYALTDRDDANHEAALAIARELGRQRWILYTTNVVLIEQHALHLSRLGRAIALQALLLIDRSDIRIVRVTAEDELAAREILTRYTDKDWSLADATSFVVMERLGIRYAFTFDSDFAQYGFTVLAPDLLLP